MIVSRPDLWLVNIGLAIGLVQSDNKPLLGWAIVDPDIYKYVAIWGD